MEDDGTVAAWVDNTFGQTNVPAGLTHAVAIAAGGTYRVALIGEPVTQPRFANLGYGSPTFRLSVPTV